MRPSILISEIIISEKVRFPLKRWERDLNRSRVIYGNSVETFGPYPRHYTTALFNFYCRITHLPTANKANHEQ